MYSDAPGLACEKGSNPNDVPFSLAPILLFFQPKPLGVLQFLLIISLPIRSDLSANRQLPKLCAHLRPVVEPNKDVRRLSFRDGIHIKLSICVGCPAE